MYVAIDESQDPEHFVVAAVGAPDAHTLEVMVGRARALVQQRRRRIEEFNESDLAMKYPDLLDWWAEEIPVLRRRKRRRTPRNDVHIWVAYYRKAGRDRTSFNKTRLHQVYLASLEAVCTGIQTATLPAEYIEVVYDSFPQASAIASDIVAVFQRTLDGNIRPGESSADKALQVADIVAGTMRRALQGQPDAQRRVEQLQAVVRGHQRIVVRT